MRCRQEQRQRQATVRLEQCNQFSLHRSQLNRNEAVWRTRCCATQRLAQSSNCEVAAWDHESTRNEERSGMGSMPHAIELSPSFASSRRLNSVGQHQTLSAHSPSSQLLLCLTLTLDSSWTSCHWPFLAWSSHTKGDQKARRGKQQSTRDA